MTGGRPGGIPKKRVAAAGKKLKQTQITTPAAHKRVVKMEEAPGEPFDHGRFEIVVEPKEAS